jgi:hypothetical protein
MPPGSEVEQPASASPAKISGSDKTRAQNDIARGASALFQIMRVTGLRPAICGTDAALSKKQVDIAARRQRFPALQAFPGTP